MEERQSTESASDREVIRSTDKGPLGWLRRTPALGAALLVSLVAGGLIFIPGMAQPTPTWRASALVRLGDVPRLHVPVAFWQGLTEPVEDVRETWLRLRDPAFQALVLEQAVLSPDTAAASQAVFESGLRGDAVSPRVIQIHVPAASRNDAMALVEGTIAQLNQIHTQMRERRFRQIVRFYDALPDDLRKRFSDVVSLEGIGKAAYSMDETQLMFGTRVSVIEPTSPSLSYAQVFAALSMFAAIVVLSWAAVGRRRAL